MGKILSSLFGAPVPRRSEARFRQLGADGAKSRKGWRLRLNADIVTKLVMKAAAMESINLADAKARFSEIVDRAEAGESIEITRRGKLAARIVPPTAERVRKPLDLEALRKLRESLPFQEQTAADLIREMRDAGY